MTSVDDITVFSIIATEGTLAEWSLYTKHNESGMFMTHHKPVQWMCVSCHWSIVIFQTHACDKSSILIRKHMDNALTQMYAKKIKSYKQQHLIGDLQYQKCLSSASKNE